MESYDQENLRAWHQIFANAGVKHIINEQIKSLALFMDVMTFLSYKNYLYQDLSGYVCLKGHDRDELEEALIYVAGIEKRRLSQLSTTYCESYDTPNGLEKCDGKAVLEGYCWNHGSVFYLKNYD